MASSRGGNYTAERGRGGLRLNSGVAKTILRLLFFFHLDLSCFIGLWAKQLQQVDTYILTGRVVWKIVKNLIDPKKVRPGVLPLFLSSCLFPNWRNNKLGFWIRSIVCCLTIRRLWVGFSLGTFCVASPASASNSICSPLVQPVQCHLYPPRKSE